MNNLLPLVSLLSLLLMLLLMSSYLPLKSIAITATHLDRQTVGIQAPLARPGLGDGRQYVQQQAGALARFLILTRTLFIHQPRAIQAQRHAAFDIGFLRQPHALHIGVLLRMVKSLHDGLKIPYESLLAEVP